MRGIILSLARDGKPRLRMALRGFSGLKIEDTRHGGLVIVRGSELDLISLLESWRIGVLSMYPVLLARPFDYEANLDGNYVYDIRQPINHFVPKLILDNHGRPRVRRLRLRVRGHGLRLGDALKEAALAVLGQYSVLTSTDSNLILSIEALRMWTGSIRVFIGLFPKRYYVKYRGLESVIA